MVAPSLTGRDRFAVSTQNEQTPRGISDNKRIQTHLPSMAPSGYSSPQQGMLELYPRHPPTSPHPTPLTVFPPAGRRHHALPRIHFCLFQPRVINSFPERLWVGGTRVQWLGPPDPAYRWHICTFQALAN